MAMMMCLIAFKVMIAMVYCVTLMVIMMQWGYDDGDAVSDILDTRIVL